MKYRFVHGKDYFDDDNDGLLFGIESDEDFPEYVEWFSSQDERKKYAVKNNMKIITEINGD